MDRSLHPMAECFGAIADLYDAARPGYPDELVGLLTGRLGIGESSAVLDAGAGTGKLTEILLRTGAHVWAAEPVTAMREHLTRLLPPDQVLAARAEVLPLDAASVDLVAAGDAFHWFDPQAGPKELARVLRPGGHLMMVHHSPFPTENRSWRLELQRLLRGMRGDHPFFVKEHGRKALKGCKAFGPVRGVTLAHHHEVDRWGLVDYVRSLSYVAAQYEDRARYEELMTEVRRIADSAPNRISLSYAVEVWITKRR